MANSAQVNWNVVKKTYGDRDPNLSTIGRECTCLFHWFASLEKVTHKYIKPSLQFQHNQPCKDCEDVKIMDKAKTKYTRS